MDAFGKQLSIPLLLFALLPFFLFPASSLAQGKHQPRTDCSPFLYKCGNVDLNISYPFRIDGSPPQCSHHGKVFKITCNQTDDSFEIRIQSHQYHIKTIDYENRILTIVDKNFFGSKSDNNSCRLSSFTNTTLDSTFLNYYASFLTFLFNCPRVDYQGFRLLECLSNKTTGTHAYFTYHPEIPEEYKNCQVVKIPIHEESRDQVLMERDAEVALNEVLRNGFQITWSAIDPMNDCWKCVQSKGHCGRNESSALYFLMDDSSTAPPPICYCDGQSHSYTCPGGVKSKRNKLILVASTGVGVLLMTCFLVFMVLLIRKLPSNNSMFFWKKKTSEARNVEAFLENIASLVPKRYRYSELKKITNSFKDNLGQGGYGSVFKGKLNDGVLVAVKALNKSKGGNGEEFLNEVASISRTRHVNVVALLGFCFEGSKRALVYEFMSNGSLDKFIYSKKQGTKNILDCQKLLEIALGIARGLEYLHRGCNTRILHLDIKPHNILLDDNFCPKISDFGLAKLCPGQQNTISMLDARGTVGYIAPEVFCRNIGRVSHKSDVYSYGMMVLEMIGGRKNIDARVDKTSEIYFPDWVHKHINIKESQGLFGFGTEEEEKIARKMVMVGLWCIQTDPANRPSMNKAMEMLEGSVESLEMPPRPYISSPPRSYSSTS